jgi:hypothetical protein
LLLCANGSVELIRRQETVADYFATLNFKPQMLMPAKTSSDAPATLRVAS